MIGQVKPLYSYLLKLCAGSKDLSLLIVTYRETVETKYDKHCNGWGIIFILIQLHIFSVLINALKLPFFNQRCLVYWTLSACYAIYDLYNFKRHTFYVQYN